MYDRVVRVAVTNNFNCTKKEFNQLDIFSRLFPESYFFINANIKTPKILALNAHPYKAVITINPDFVTADNLIETLYKISPEKIVFIRIKYLPGWPSILNLIEKISNSYPVVVTLQRFNSKKSIAQYVRDYNSHYDFSHSRYRLKVSEVDHLKHFISLISSSNIYICDEKEIGCEGCGLCSKLTLGEDLPIYSLNLSSSGICPFSCVDCYAKTMQHFLKNIGKNPIIYDHISKNRKQTGRTSHIREHLKETSNANKTCSTST
jgi:hypothetical protein